MSRWFISNISLKNDLGYQIRFNEFELHYDNDFIKKYKDSGLIIGIDGFVIPRNFCYEKYCHLKNEELIKHLYEKKGLKFIDFIKGIFTIFIIEEKRFFVFNDRNSIKKFFIYQDRKKFLIASDLAIISGSVDLNVNAERTALFCLMSHFIGGMTLFKNVNYSGPATFVNYEEILQISQYWLPDELLNLQERKYSFQELAEFWKYNIINYIEYLKPSGITMTLTGGNDTRMILAALLNLGIKPNTFTFGNPESLDAITARKVADSQKLKYQTHYIDNPDPSWLTRRGIEIIDKGNSLLNIHRAHRLDAIKREMESNSANEMIFVGDMGGEYTHGFSYTDYITSKLFRLWKQDDKAFNIELIKTLLKEGYFNEDKVNLDQIYTILCEQPFIHNKGKFGNFHVEYYLDAAVHHTQDMNLYLKNLKYLVCPFMDVDYLEVLFSSPYHMPLNEGDAKKNHIMEIWKPNLRLTVTHILAPELSDIEYGKKGYYSANEFFGNKFVILLKRIYRYKFKCKLTPTFAYREWITDFVRQSFNNLSEKTKYLLDMDLYQEDLLQTDHGTEEGYWHRFTNWINIDFIIKKYIKKNEKI